MKGNFRKRDGSANSRKNGNVDNNYTNGGGSNNQNNGSLFYENAETTKHFEDRQDYLLANSIGSIVTVTVTSGVKYTGLLVSCNLESTNGIDVVLRFPRMADSEVSSSADYLAKTLGETLLIHGEDVAELELRNIDLSLDEKWENSKVQEATSVGADSEKDRSDEGLNEGGKFRTDVDISGSGREIKERKLEKWTPEEGTENFDINKGQALEDNSTAWDQFAVNEKKFGVKSTFDEHLYTTKINKNDPNYGKRLQEAERIAKEIESQGTSGNIHIAEDRGIIIDDSGLDEEDLYSGVDRRGDELLAALKSNSKPNASKGNRYVPPTLRQQPHHMDPAIISSSNSNNDENVAATGTTSPAEAEAIREKVPQKNSKSKKGLSNKEAQIEELKKFSEKFKVPYDMPKDMPEVLKRSNSILKSNSSLPPKPVSKAPSAKIGSPIAQVSAGRTESRRSGSNISQGQSSAGHTRSSTSSRRRNHGSFFGAKNPHTNDAKRAAFGKSFNMFIKSKEAHDEKQRGDDTSDNMEPFFIEKPYFTAPTWLNTIEESYKTFFPDEDTAIQEAQTRFQQRQMNSMGNGGPGMNPNMGMNMGGMMGFPMGGPSASANPMMNGFAANSMGMYMPFQPQPMFYHPSMPQMMPVMGNNGAEEGGGNISPHMPTGFMAAGPGAPMGAFGYPGGMPFQGMMGSGPSGMPASGSAMHSHGHGRNYHQTAHHGHHNNSTSGHK
ncbi:Pbp1p [Saccharomyces cerevisiae x Saccharomyces kudriavzevii VIN7]|uniref:Pbp1p n=1 Tax=Saccharomyces cerevisiae x Saccharomyces kudriavzevii (strain VIN7) TaxID=1095631 RepID=H0GV97_SACCK|nr:Pbp1p [Saccharomyces cerevisiae x Saccharomyces kudriavzevii VIN7]CAI5274800.1 AIS_HP2_G0020520.mRNA.1.CDS.1 [Saccharomyces cerevisiae]CAI6528348.1 AIS_HP2_G0020520.mRNA.1.CDS.1 [Saccharomyces cerevisiae]